MQEAGPTNRLRAAVREPLVHFLLIGAALFVLDDVAGTSPETPSEQRITVTAGELDWLADSWKKRWNRAPTPEELDGLIDGFVRETVLYREALAMGLDADDTIIRRRLAQKLEFLTQDLVATVRPTDAELRTFFAENTERYELPALTTFSHVFVDPDVRGDSTLADAERIGAELAALDPPTEGSEQLGDRFMLQSDYPQRSESEIGKLFGSEFARSVAGLETGRWEGPILSGYGVHWVFVEHRSEVETPTFEAVREQVEQDWDDDRREQFNEEFYANLRSRYDVVIEDEGEPTGGTGAPGDAR